MSRALVCSTCLYLVAAFSFWGKPRLLSPPPAPKTYIVETKQMQFQPATLSVHKGDTVVFINRDVVTHNATEATGKLWQTPALASGKSWRMALTRSASYYCSFHPVMKGTILVI